jgi:hypothetical protein
MLLEVMPKCLSVTLMHREAHYCPSAAVLEGHAKNDIGMGDEPGGVTLLLGLLM